MKRLNETSLLLDDTLEKSAFFRNIIYADKRLLNAVNFCPRLGQVTPCLSVILTVLCCTRIHAHC